MWPEGVVSVDVLREVFTLSQSRGVARNVLTVLADAAHPDGVTWLPVTASKSGDPSKCIAHRANASVRAVRASIVELVELGEIEVRQAQRGRARINVYRVVLGSAGEAEVDYTDLPFDLEQPFGRLSADSALSRGGDVVQFSSRPSAESVTDRVQFSSLDEPAQRGTAAGVAATFAAPYPSVEPSHEPEVQIEPPEQERSRVAALVENSLKSGQATVDVQPLLDLLPLREIKPNTRSVLERKFSQLPPRFVEMAIEELLERERDPLAEDVRSRVRYFNGIADRMLRERADRATPTQDARRWVDENFDHPDAEVVIDGFEVDAFERQSLHERAETLRAAADTSTRKVA